MANTKKQIVLDMELVDDIHSMLLKLLTHYEHELIWERESYSDKDFLLMAENYGRTKKILLSLLKLEHQKE